MLESEWGLSRVIYYMQFYLVIAVCIICMEFFLFCERNVLRTRNGGIEEPLLLFEECNNGNFCKENFLLTRNGGIKGLIGTKIPIERHL